MACYTYKLYVSKKGAHPYTVTNVKIFWKFDRTSL